MKNGLWLLTGNMIYAISQWLILVVLSQFFTKDELGSYFFALAIVAPLALLFSLKLPNLVVVLEESLVGQKSIFFCRFLLSLILIFCSYIIYFLFFNENTNISILISVLIYKILEQNDDVIAAYFQKCFLFKNIFILKLWRSIIYLIFIFLCCLLFDNIENVLIISTFGYSVFWILRNRRFIQFSSLSKEKKYLIHYFKSGYYLALSSSISSLNVSGVRLYIGYVLGNSVLAIYGVISYTLTIFSIVVAALGQYFLPLFVKDKNNFKKFKYHLVKSQIFMLFIGLLCVLISFFAGDFLLGLFYGSDYGSYGLYLCLIFIANIFKSSSALMGTAMTAKNIYNFQLKFTIISLIITLILVPIFVLKFNILGAFLALVAVAFFEWLLYIFFFKQLMRDFIDENL